MWYHQERAGADFIKDSKGVKGMKYGIYFAYWEKDWEADYQKHIENVAKLGFDILEIGCAPIEFYSESFMDELRAAALDHHIRLTAGYGPPPHRNLSSSDPVIAEQAKKYFIDLMKRLHRMNITSVGGGLNSYWPVDYAQPIDKERDWATAVKNVREVAKVAGDLGIDYLIECLNRFEGYLTNTAEEGAQFCREVGLPNVRLLLDTFHMNIEEDSFTQAILTAGRLLGRLHVGEANRKVPGQGRLPWAEIGQALKSIRYDGDVVMEPFVLQGGQVGKDIKIWRNLVASAGVEEMNRDARGALAFLKSVF